MFDFRAGRDPFSFTHDIFDGTLRVPISLTVDSYAVVNTGETLIDTLGYSRAGQTVVTVATGYVVPNGFRFRLLGGTATLHTIAGNTTNVTGIVRLRAAMNGQALAATSPLQWVAAVAGAGAANSAGQTTPLAVPGGMDFLPGSTLGFSVSSPGFVSTTAAPKIDITVFGFEFPI